MARTKDTTYSWIEALPQAAAILKEAVVVRANEALQRLTGHDPTGLLITDLLRHLPPASSELIRFESPLRRASNIPCLVQATLSNLPDGNALLTLQPQGANQTGDTVQVDNLSVAVFRTNEAGQLLYANPAFMRLFGFPPDTLAETISVSDLYHNPQQRQIGINRARFATGREYLEIPYKRADGAVLWCRVYGRAVYDDDGNMRYIEGLIFDNSEEHAARTQQNQDETSFRRLAETSPDEIWIVEPATGRMIYVNRPIFLGHNIASMITYHEFLSFVHPDDVASLRQQFQNTDPDNVVEFRVQSDTGEWAWYASRLVMLESMEHMQSRLLVTLTDVRRHHRYEEEQAEQNRILKAIQAVSLAVSSSLQLEQVLAELLEQVGTIIPYTSASVFVLEGELMRFIAGVNLPPDVVTQLTSDLQTMSTLSRHILDTQKPHLIPDTTSNANWFQIPETEYILSWMGIPLIVDDEIVGIINLDHEQADTYDEHYFERAVLIGRQAAVAIRNARLYQQALNEISRRQEAEQVLIANLMRTDALYETGRTLLSALDVGAVLPDILAHVRASLNLAGLCVMVASPLVAQVQMYTPADQTQCDEADCWEALHGRRIMPDQPGEIISNLTTPHHFQLADGRHGLALPLWKQAVFMACMNASDPLIQSEDTEVLVLLSHQIAIALENASLTSQLRDYASDLEERVQEATSSLRVERQRLQAILDGMGEGIVYLEDGFIRYANPAFCQMMGMRFDALRDSLWTSLMIGSPEMMLGSDNNRQRNEARLARADGDSFVAHLLVTRIDPDQDDESLRQVIVVRDISLDYALREQRSRFITNAAHELRNPLTSVMLRVHMLQRQPDRYQEHTQHLETAATYLHAIVEDLLELSRIESKEVTLEYETVSINDLIQKAIERQQAYITRRQITVEYLTPGPDLHAVVDAARIQQLIEKLLINALNYAQPQDWIQIGVMRVYVAGLPYVSLWVTDNGNSLDPQLLPDRVFQPFSRPRMGDQRETGMTLAIAHHIANLHGGWMIAQALDVNTITTYLPIKPQQEMDDED